MKREFKINQLYVWKNCKIFITNIHGDKITYKQSDGIDLVGEVITEHEDKLRDFLDMWKFELVEKGWCDHTYQNYVGFTDVYKFCTKCGRKDNEHI